MVQSSNNNYNDNNLYDILSIKNKFIHNINKGCR